MSPLEPVLLAAAICGGAPVDAFSADQWLSAYVFHTSRTFPALDRVVDTPLDPGIEVGYHRVVFGGKPWSLGFSAQGAFQTYDQLFWALALGTGAEGAYRGDWGGFAALGLRLDYARLFTGTNHFVHENGRYQQETDAGRGFLRVTPVDLSLGFAPAALRRIGLVPALRYTWLLDLPLYPNDGANPWSYSTFGLYALWAWEGAP